MGVIRELMSVKGGKRAGKLIILFDSGVTRSLIRRDVAEELAEPSYPFLLK